MDDHELWQALLDDLCSANGVPFHLCAGDSAGEYSLQGMFKQMKHATYLVSWRGHDYEKLETEVLCSIRNSSAE